VEYVIKIDIESGYQAMAEEWQGEQDLRVCRKEKAPCVRGFF